MKDNGKVIICMVKVYIPGKMGENMKENINLIRSMVSGLIIGQMEKVITFVFINFFNRI